MKNTIKMSIVCALAVTALQAEEEIVLAPLEVVSSAIETDELHATDAIEIYTQEDIEKAHVQNIYEFLNKESSVVALPSYGNPFTQKLDMRGYGYENGYQNIVVTVNGRKLNNVDMVPQLLSSISPNQIERIEIIKSSGIVKAGDGANAGVINIVTKQANETSIGAYAGIYNTFDGTFFVGHTDEKFSVNVAGEAQKSAGIRYIDDNGNKDSNKFSNFSLEFTYTPMDELELRLNALTSNIDVWYASYLTLDEYNEDVFQKGETNWGATHQTYTSDVIGTGVSYYINSKISLNADFSHEYKTSEYVTYASLYQYTYNSYDVNVQYDDASYKIVMGLNGFAGSVLKSGAIDLEKNNVAGYVVGEMRYDALTLKAGYRYEEVEFKNILNSQDNTNEYLHGIEAGMNYRFDNEESAFVSYSHSFETSSLDRMFSFFTGTYTGYVKPAIADSYTLGYNYIGKQNKFKFSMYYIDLQDEIYYYSDPTYVNSQNTNIDESHKYGLDLYEKYIFDNEWNFVFNYNYVMAKIDKEVQNGEDYSGKELPGVSNHNVKFTLNYMPNDQTTFSLTQLYRSEAYAANDFNNDFDQKQDPFYSTDIAVTYHEKSWEVFAKVNNIFNQKNGIWIKDEDIYPVNFTTTALAGFKLKY